jgi:hypothetical protein
MILNYSIVNTTLNVYWQHIHFDKNYVILCYIMYEQDKWHPTTIHRHAPTQQPTHQHARTNTPQSPRCIPLNLCLHIRRLAIGHSVRTFPCLSSYIMRASCSYYIAPRPCPILPICWSCGDIPTYEWHYETCLHWFDQLKNTQMTERTWHIRNIHKLMSANQALIARIPRPSHVWYNRQTPSLHTHTDTTITHIHEHMYTHAHTRTHTHTHTNTKRNTRTSMSLIVLSHFKMRYFVWNML